mmetsp:Transcript_12242/g.17077  ORF Transcript_12242/g.17077 Transcript_12242/m.17077 type:complete len:315 (-) Transcript_12242:66-1010(-)
MLTYYNRSVFALTFAATISSVVSGGLMIPLYTWPTIAQNSAGDYECVSNEWQKVASSVAANNTIAIVNPSNGPNYGSDPWKKLSYDTCIEYLKSSSVEVSGYVHTKVGYPDISGYRPYCEVKDDIDMWKNEYDVDGIFIDEVSNRWLASWDSLKKVTDFNQLLVDYVIDDLGYDRAILNPGGAYFENIMVPYFGNPKVIAVVFEGQQWSFQRGDCIWGLWDTTQGSFTNGPWCQYVPNWDGIEPLKGKMDDGSILPEQSAALIYGAASTAEATEDSIEFGTDANVGWFYILDNWSAWSSTPSQLVLNTQAAMVL